LFASACKKEDPEQESTTNQSNAKTVFAGKSIILSSEWSRVVDSSTNYFYGFPGNIDSFEWLQSAPLDSKTFSAISSSQLITLIDSNTFVLNGSQALVFHNSGV
jgi:hypothetical protein